MSLSRSARAWFHEMRIVHPVAAPRFAIYAHDDTACASSPWRSLPEAKSRLSFLEGAVLIEVAVALPRDDARCRREPEIPSPSPRALRERAPRRYRRSGLADAQRGPDATR